MTRPAGNLITLRCLGDNRLRCTLDGAEHIDGAADAGLLIAAIVMQAAKYFDVGPADIIEAIDDALASGDLEYKG